MKVLLYLEAENFLRKSGIRRTIKHQKCALTMVGQECIINLKDDYDLVHTNTYGPKNWHFLVESKRAGKKVPMHDHPTEEGFRDPFIGSNLVLLIFRWYPCRFYQKADAIITPAEYSESLIAGYGIKRPVYAVPDGIDSSRYASDSAKEETFRRYFNIKPDEKVVVCAGLYFMRKGIDEFIKIAEQMPDARFTWSGETNKWVVLHKVRGIATRKHPSNVTFVSYTKGDVFEGAMSGVDAFFFPSCEEAEGIVVLEALVSHQHVVLCDIPAYHGWADESCAELATDVGGFVGMLRKVLAGKSQKRETGYKVTESRSTNRIAHELVDVYEKVMEL